MMQKRTSTFIAIFVTATCVVVMCYLGFWQLDRMTQKQQRLASITQKQGNDSFDLLHALSLDDPRDVSVTFQGVADNQHVFLLDNQIHQSRIGFDVVVPMLTNAGWLLVNYGWIQAPDKVRTLPTITIDNVASHFEGIISIPQNNPMITETLSSAPQFPALIQQVSIARIKQILDLDLLPYVVQLTGDSATFVRAYTPVVMPPEKHLGYAVQWFALALAAAFIGGIAIIKKGRSYE